MNTQPYILDVPLPKSQNFKLLKEEALEFIQQVSGNAWTNLNASDPGVTILDQVCFALTELGYCNEFELSDILTMPNGKLQVENQFYLPEEILTTSPVTLADYRKYIIDGVDGIFNAIVTPSIKNNSTNARAYQVYLYIDPAVTDPQMINDICNATFFYLNKSRNLGELFLMPQALQPATHLINGWIEINDEKQLQKTLLQVQDAINNYIFPRIIAATHQDATALGDKKDLLRTIELAHVISNVPGVSNTAVSAFDNTLTEISANAEQLLVADIMKSVTDGYLTVLCKGKKLLLNSNQNNASSAGRLPQNNSIVIETATGEIDVLPKGKFRHINSYYSIQNTFPEIFGVGPDAIIANLPDYQVAQSRQLKGYLTLFDQVLANQFSQLANVNQLFSFTNATTGTPSDEASYYEMKDQFKKDHPQYPVPYRSFSPTYFYQSLYDVPHIRPLLKGYDTFQFSIERPVGKELERKSWMDFKDDPYNPYIRGLMEFVEDEDIALQRRNDILDHLLARHGESPAVIDAIIEGSRYSGDSAKDRILIKSIYLQNLALLSYYRFKAYNVKAAAKIANGLQPLPTDLDQFYPGRNSINFIVDSARMEEEEKLEEKHFIHFSALELKLCLLLGLKTEYKDFIINNYDNKENNMAALFAQWMIQERRGVILIETALLLWQLENRNTQDTALAYDVILILPDFIPSLNIDEFKERLEFFLGNDLPVNLSHKCFFVPASLLWELVPAFADWRNSLVYPHQSNPQEKSYSYSAAALANILSQLKIPGHE